MESSNTPLINCLTKVGTSVNILVFYGFWDDWKKLLVCLWKATQEFWSKNEHAFVGLDHATFRDKLEISKLIRLNEIYKDMENKINLPSGMISTN